MMLFWSLLESSRKASLMRRINGQTETRRGRKVRAGDGVHSGDHRVRVQAP